MDKVLFPEGPLFPDNDLIPDIIRLIIRLLAKPKIEMKVLHFCIGRIIYW